MFLIRPAVIGDLAALFVMAEKETKRYENLKLDHRKLRDSLRTAISAKTHGFFVVEKDGKIVGALASLTTSPLWAQREVSAIQWWTGQNLFQMRALMREYVKWVKGRRVIRVAGLMSDLNDIDDQIWTIAEQCGFEKSGGGYLLYN